MLGLLDKKVHVYHSILTFSVLVAACADIPADTSLAAQSLEAQVEPGVAEPALPQVKMVTFSATGDGCKPGTSDIVLSSDGSHAEARFPAYDVAIGPERALVDTKVCELRIVARASTGFYFAFRKVQVDMEGVFDPGVKASLSARQFFPGGGSIAYLLNIPLESPLKSGDGLGEVVFPTERQLQQGACGKEQEVRLQSLISLHDRTHTLHGALRVSRIQFDLADVVVRPCSAP